MSGDVLAVVENGQRGERGVEFGCTRHATPRARRIVGVTGLIAAALVGLIAAQVWLRHRACTQELRLFDQRVDGARRRIVETINTRDAGPRGELECAGG